MLYWTSVQVNVSGTHTDFKEMLATQEIQGSLSCSEGHRASHFLGSKQYHGINT